MVHLESLAAGDLQFVRVEAELVQRSRVDVGDVVAVLDSVETQLVRGSVLDAGLDAAAREPRAEALRMMVAPVERKGVSS